jgi:predicted RNA-binding protein associated with RNAse of E/G family
VASTPEIVRIHYRRPPHRDETFDQTVLARTAECVVTYLPRAAVSRPIEIDGRISIEPGAPIVWFTFPGLWHDIGRFHTADGTFSGLYANVLTPVEGVDSAAWRTTDLFLDVWQPASGNLRVLDVDELEAALAAGWIDEGLARRAQHEAATIVEAAKRGVWPPAIVAEWPLERARAAVGET